ALAACVAVLLVGVTATSLVAAASEARAAKQERAAREEAEEARLREAKLRKQAEENLERARSAVDQHITRISESLLQEPGMQDLRKELESALELYEGILREGDVAAAPGGGSGRKGR